MVTSGLFDRLDVSPLRLAIHLGMALLILAIAFWVALGAFGWPRETSRFGAPPWAPAVLLVLIFVQAILGALLAGSDGGRAYADWPTIGGEWLPLSAFGLESCWANFTEDHATQHLLHRTSGYVVGLFALGLALAAALRGEGEAQAAGVAIGALALLQVMLGVLTVLAAAPLSLSLLHQFGAVALWIATLGTVRLVRR
jgi:cytochrome c oxidase assembly protein subunit 15